MRQGHLCEIVACGTGKERETQKERRRGLRRPTAEFEIALQIECGIASPLWVAPSLHIEGSWDKRVKKEMHE